MESAFFNFFFTGVHFDHHLSFLHLLIETRKSLSSLGSKRVTDMAGSRISDVPSVFLSLSGVEK